MKNSLSLLIIAIVFAVGCGKAPDSAETTASETGKEAKNKGPTKVGIDVGSRIQVKRGETAKVSISAIRKGREEELKADPNPKETVMYRVNWYQGEIQLEFDTSDVPGLKIEPATIPAGAEKIEVTVSAGADAEPTFGRVQITAKGGDGAEPFGPVIVEATIR